VGRVVRAGKDFVGRGCRDVKVGEHIAVEGGSWGYIDQRGRVVVPVTFSWRALPTEDEARQRLRGAE
jgi:hypothetical protein